MKKKIYKKTRCPKCGEPFLDNDDATRHSKENKHWGDYNIYPSQPPKSRTRGMKHKE
jgi:hypothetical protein